MSENLRNYSAELVEKPNIIIFMPDQLRYDAIGTFGNNAIHTPNIDSLARNGTKFTNCYLQHSVCSQSRASIVTSKYPHSTGHRGLKTYLKPWEDNFFKTLKQNGYYVSSVGSRGDIFSKGATELSSDEYGFFKNPEFGYLQVWEAMLKKKESHVNDETDWGRLYYTGSRGDEAVYDFDEAVIQTAEKWLDTTGKTLKKPWVLFLPLIFPHCPFGVEEPYFSMYKEKSLPKPLNYKLKTGHEPLYMQKLRTLHGLETLSDEVWNEVIATYYGMISRIDDQLGRILSKVDDSNTVKFFFTDHGEYLGDHSLIEKWPAGVSEQLVHEPLIISGPGIPKGKIVDSFAEMVDLGPTIFELTGLNTRPYPHNGKSLLPIIYDKVETHRNEVFSEGGFLFSEESIIEYAPYPYDIKANLQHTDTNTVGRVVAIRNEEYTFVLRLYEKNELYSRRYDLQEAHNLIDDPKYQDTIKDFESKLLRWFFETSDHAPNESDPRQVEVDLPVPGSLVPLKTS
ncbi:uncharacterized protein PRCAT00005073001 [Priceomyces carsonii]|uniref:uncharacterized protein n=1 Tax=Priceomyces carsonii TaxID=28549 RepID=UPI002EDB72F5|nr:unnamed protein product [Priceomyces carsonii]